ncbi:unnamed protein product [Cyprideis torosa]|uniref:Uncharacterized protein n=1 Tax=Cyprideis torosa TaxID=163714 RepID=A0A7R8WGN8_9CRUS|nr:unnamed protein product [Cyprideis torosa]CAG0896833.1 unnamed protein product [Cyprideis torosa]
MPRDLDERTLRDHVRFGITGFFLIAAIVAFSCFVFLIPFVLDPAFSTVKANFVEEPVLCEVIASAELSGMSNCSWSSCRVGCTRELTSCVQINVRYNPINETTSEWDSGEGKLFINIKGCGYPPSVNCSVFTVQYGSLGDRFPCYYSRSDPSVVVPSYDMESAQKALLYATLIPSTVFMCSVMSLCMMYVAACRRKVLKRAPWMGYVLEKEIYEDEAVNVVRSHKKR